MNCRTSLAYDSIHAIGLKTAIWRDFCVLAYSIYLT
jgi:hypothetical protein